MKAQKSFLPFPKGLALLCVNGRIGCNVLTGLWEFQELSPPEVINGFFPATTEFAARPAARRHQRATASHRSSRGSRGGKKQTRRKGCAGYHSRHADAERAAEGRNDPKPRGTPGTCRGAPAQGGLPREAPHNFSGSGGALKESGNRSPPADWSGGSVPPEEPPAAAVTSSRAPPPCRRPGTRLRAPFLSAPPPSAAVPVPAAGVGSCRLRRAAPSRGESGTAPTAARPRPARPRGGAAGLSRPGVRAPGGAVAAAPPQPRPASPSGGGAALRAHRRRAGCPPAARGALPRASVPSGPAAARVPARRRARAPCWTRRWREGLGGTSSAVAPSALREPCDCGPPAPAAPRPPGGAGVTPSKTPAKSLGVSSIINEVWVFAYPSRRHSLPPAARHIERDERKPGILPAEPRLVLYLRLF